MAGSRPATNWTHAGRARRGSVLELALVKIAVVLDAGHTQALHARAIDRALPGCKLLQRQAIAFKHLVDVVRDIRINQEIDQLIAA